jgi:predicted nucleic acid-binding protein
LKNSTAALCDPIRMEVLAGARNELQEVSLHRTLARATLIETNGTHYTMAASLYRVCRRNGETVRSMLDCVIAAVAIDAGLPVLHADRDFEVLARHTPLRVA